MVKLTVKQDSCLNSWNELNDVMKNASEEVCEIILGSEKLVKRRKQFLLRIHSRLNKVRADRERMELKRIAS